VADQLITLGGCCSDRTLIINSSMFKDHQFINVQGDQPFLDPAVIEAMVAEFSRRSPTPEVLTPVFRMCGM
jgi:3-deoxy-manno-octulosonate cytidylyltransferase (CMP-KDO synthetase)